MDHLKIKVPPINIKIVTNPFPKSWIKPINMNVHHFDKKIGNIEQSQRSFQKIQPLTLILSIVPSINQSPCSKKKAPLSYNSPLHILKNREYLLLK